MAPAPSRGCGGSPPPHSSSQGRPVCRGGEPWRPAVGTGRLALVVGPEGGWTEAEAAALEELGCGATALGPTVLRVETAAVVAAGLALAGSR
jgi:16S rRNA U1498 N3-methylase RsmE